MLTEDMTGAEPVETTEEGVEAVSTTEEVESTGPGNENDGWGNSRSEDTLSDDLSTAEEGEEEAPLEEGEKQPEKSPIQRRFDELTTGKKSSDAQVAHLTNTNNFLLQELNKVKQATPQAPPVETAKEPVFADFKEKYPEDSEKAQTEWLAARQDFKLNGAIAQQKQNEAISDLKEKMLKASSDFTQGSYDADIMKKYPDFQSVVFHPTAGIDNSVVRYFIESSPQKYAIAYKLATDTELRNKLNVSSQVGAGKIVGDLERLYSSPVNRRFKSKAAKAVAKIGTGNKALSGKEEDMDMDDFIKKEEAKISSGGGW